MSIERTGKLEVRSSKGVKIEFDCLYDPRSSAVSWVFLCDDSSVKSTLKEFRECIGKYMDMPEAEREDGDLVQVLLHKLSGSSTTCVPNSLFKKIPKYPYELVQQTLAVCE